MLQKKSSRSRQFSNNYDDPLSNLAIEFMNLYNLSASQQKAPSGGGFLDTVKLGLEKLGFGREYWEETCTPPVKALTCCCVVGSLGIVWLFLRSL